jgi:hypothetical protein|tara:strand:- start:1337 stop:2452 length:1116 start_codon:yes stop_codon:yes gene_type:complete
MKTPDHADRGHAEFSPSSLKYCAGCAGYNGREGTNPAAEMGTRIHEALEILDPSNLQSEQEISIYEEIIADQTEYLKNYEDRELTETHSEIVLDIELKGTSTFGTCDHLSIYGKKEGVLIDYKTGISVIETPRDNYQARAYTVGCFQRFPELEEITFVFFIPQRNEILSDTFKRSELEDLINDLSSVILEAERVRPKWEGGTPSLGELTPTVNCRFCKFEDICPALGGLVVEVAKKINPQLPDVDLDSTEDPEVLEQLWAIQKIVTYWADGFKKRCIKLAQDGLEFPNLRLKKMSGRRNITNQKIFMQIAKDFGMDSGKVLEQVSIPLAKIAKSIGETAERGQKKTKAESFIKTCQSHDIIEESSSRHTLS